MSDTEVRVLIEVDGELFALGSRPVSRDGERPALAIAGVLRAVATHIEAWAVWDEGEGAA